MKNVISCLVMAIFFIFSFEQKAMAQKKGGKIILVDDGVSNRCISRADIIQIGLMGVRIYKKRNWFSNQTKAGVQIDSKVSGVDTDYSAKTANITQIYQVDVQDFNKGQISLPISGSVIGNFPLQNKGISYTGIGMSLTLLEATGKTTFGSTVSEIIKLTNSVPFPTTPFDPVIKQLFSFASDLVSPANDADNKIQRDQLPAATIDLEFGTDGSCDDLKVLQKSGVFAIIYNSENDDTSDPGYVDIDHTENYDFKYQARPTREILVGKKDQAGHVLLYAPISNEHVSFYIIAIPKNLPPGGRTTTSVAINTSTKIKPNILLGNLSNHLKSFDNLNSKYSLKITGAATDLYDKNKIAGVVEDDTNKRKVNSYNLDNADLLVASYLEAARRLTNLGLLEEIKKLPDLPAYMITKK